MAGEPAVVDAQERNRFEIIDDGRIVGFCEYHENPDGSVTMPHTVVDPSMRGRGIGRLLVSAAVDNLRSRGMEIHPTCWFVAEYLDSESA